MERREAIRERGRCKRNQVRHDGFGRKKNRRVDVREKANRNGEERCESREREDRVITPYRKSVQKKPCSLDI
jgi:hypothetical protein